MEWSPLQLLEAANRDQANWDRRQGFVQIPLKWWGWWMSEAQKALVRVKDGPLSTYQLNGIREDVHAARITTIQRDDPREGWVPAGYRVDGIDARRLIKQDIPHLVDEVAWQRVNQPVPSVWIMEVRDAEGTEITDVCLNPESAFARFLEYESDDVRHWYWRAAPKQPGGTLGHFWTDEDDEGTWFELWGPWSVAP